MIAPKSKALSGRRHRSCWIGGAARWGARRRSASSSARCFPKPFFARVEERSLRRRPWRRSTSCCKTCEATSKCPWGSARWSCNEVALLSTTSREWRQLRQLRQFDHMGGSSSVSDSRLGRCSSSRETLNFGPPSLSSKCTVAGAPLARTSAHSVRHSQPEAGPTGTLGRIACSLSIFFQFVSE
jgi:hypothetical protein